MQKMTATALSHSDAQRTRWSLILGVTIWFLHLNLFYGLASLACVWGWFSFRLAGLPGLAVVEASLTTVALALMLLMIYLPWRGWRRYQSLRPSANPGLLHDTERDRRPLTAFMAMLLNSLLCLFILAAFVPIVTLNACSQL
jgi:hypothetical protein